mmetsp:Transcript_23986/g.46680  ORF Transcript_23986/g.46680 Transcript_23986/m.46680 type:complete len:94 (-) Transcript_23986:55-336(-)
MVEESSPLVSAVEASLVVAANPGPPSKMMFARLLRRTRGTTSTATSALHCPPIVDSARDDENSDEWPEEQLSDQLRMCFTGCSSGPRQRIDLY